MFGLNCGEFNSQYSINAKIYVKEVVEERTKIFKTRKVPTINGTFFNKHGSFLEPNHLLVIISLEKIVVKEEPQRTTKVVWLLSFKLNPDFSLFYERCH